MTPVAAGERIRVAVLDDYQNVALVMGPWSELAPMAHVTVFNDHINDEDALVERLAAFEVVVAMRERTPFPASVLRRLPALRLLVTTGMANASIDFTAAAELGVVVSGTCSTADGTLELTWGLILGLARSIVAEDRGLRAGGWQTTIGTDLAGSTLGVIGLGRIGTRVAAVGQAFEMRVIAWSEHLDADRAASLGVTAVTKRELFSTADFVTVHLKLSERTRAIVGAAELASMRPSAYLVNTSRGPIVDSAALLDALVTGRIAGAGLDVFDTEPLPADDPLRSAPRTLCTPHLGYVTKASYAAYFADAVDDIAAFLDGRPVRVLSA